MIYVLLQTAFENHSKTEKMIILCIFLNQCYLLTGS